MLLDVLLQLIILLLFLNLVADNYNDVTACFSTVVPLYITGNGHDTNIVIHDKQFLAHLLSVNAYSNNVNAPYNTVTDRNTNVTVHCIIVFLLAYFFYGSLYQCYSSI